jgi:uncharacterized protein
MSTPESPAPPKKNPRSRLRRWTIYLIQVAFLSYLGVVVIMFAIQDKFIFPGSVTTQGAHDAILSPGFGYDLLTLPTANGGKIAAIFGKALGPDGKPLADVRDRPSVIYFYGNGACMAYSTDVFDELRRLGVNCIVPEYPGYGMSPGKPSEAGCYAAADAGYDYLTSRNDIDPKKIVAMGWSLGGAMAIDLASRRDITGIITLSAFTSMPAVAHQVIPWLPVSLILKYRFDNVDKLARISSPILIIHGEQDDLVPFTMASKLAQAAKGKVTRFNVEGAGHNDIFDSGGENLLQQIGKFLQQFEQPTTEPTTQS